MASLRLPRGAATAPENRRVAGACAATQRTRPALPAQPLQARPTTSCRRARDAGGLRVEMFRTVVLTVSLLGAAAPVPAHPFERVAASAVDAAPPRAQADEAPSRAGEWRLLGPAFSYHFSRHYAPVRQPEQWHECPSGAADLAAPTSDGCYLAVDGRYYKIDAVQQRGWYQNNPALGLSYTRRHADHALAYSAGLVTDSFGKLGAIGLVAWLWPLHEGTLRIDGGVAGGLWYRTECDGGPHRVVPAVMPALTLTHRASGLGVNLGFAPRFTIAGRGNAVDALMLQTTLAF